MIYIDRGEKVIKIKTTPEVENAILTLLTADEAGYTYSQITTGGDLNEQKQNS